VRAWEPERDVVLVADGSIAVMVLGDHCQRLRRPVKMVSRLRLDVRL